MARLRPAAIARRYNKVGEAGSAIATDAAESSEMGNRRRQGNSIVLSGVSTAQTGSDSDVVKNTETTNAAINARDDRARIV